MRCSASSQDDWRSSSGARPQPGPGETLVRVRRAGVCGTDFHIYEGSHPFLNYPRVIGHELSGEVAETGPGCRLEVGRPVYVDPLSVVRDMRRLPARQDELLPAHRGARRPHRRRHGGIRLRAGDAISPRPTASRSIRPRWSSSSSIGAHAARRAAPRKGDRALVVGAGPIGLGCMIFARLRGGSVTALDMREDRLAFCRDVLGIEDTLVAGADTVERLSALTGGDIFDVVFDATGNAASMNAGFDYVAHGGTYVLVSVVRDTISFADPKFHAREITLLGSRNATREDFLEVLTAIRDGHVPTDALATHRAPLEQSPDAFRRMDQAGDRRDQGPHRGLGPVMLPIRSRQDRICRPDSHAEQRCNAPGSGWLGHLRHARDEAERSRDPKRGRCDNLADCSPSTGG